MISGSWIVPGFQSKPCEDRTQVIYNQPVSTLKLAHDSNSCIPELTRRGTPSGSPILITVCSCLESDEPVYMLAFARSANSLLPGKNDQAAVSPNSSYPMCYQADQMGVRG